MKHLKVLLINPHIYDFAAYSFWSSPLGLLQLGAVLRQNGLHVAFIDCMKTLDEKRKPDGRAPFLKAKSTLPLPPPLKAIKKRLKRYGISPDQLRERLALLDPPDLVLITTIMTYWYGGASEAARTAREAFPHAKIIMGGIYPSLCSDHALAHMKDADLVLGHRETDTLYRYIEETFSTTLPFKPSMYDLNHLPYPAFDLSESLPFIPLLTSYGCAFNCTYCATPYMHPRIVRRDPAHVLDEIRHWHERGVKRIVMYDDNLLYRSDLYAAPLFDAISRLPFSLDIYNPNAVNAAFLDDRTARLLVAAGFRDIRIGLETVDPATQRSTGGKVNLQVFERALDNLARAGFPINKVGVYILSGLPFQRWETVRAAIDYLSSFGVRTEIAEYTPIPHTPLFDQHHAAARYPVAQDPIYQNNALFPFAWEGFTEEDLSNLKRYLKEINPKP